MMAGGAGQLFLTGKISLRTIAPRSGQAFFAQRLHIHGCKV
jgi:hypothetical protein